MFYFVALLIALSSSQAFSANVFKCLLPNGQVQFSDRPCDAAAQEEKIEVKAQVIGGSFAPSEELRVEQDLRRIRGERRAIERRYDAAQQQFAKAPCRDFSSTTLRTLIVRRQVVAGMTKSDAVRSWGPPSRVNGSQHAYHWEKDGPSYFYTQNGCVRSVTGTYGG